MTHGKTPQRRAFPGGTTQSPVKTVCKDTLSKPRKTPALREFVDAGVSLRHTGVLLLCFRFAPSPRSIVSSTRLLPFLWLSQFASTLCELSRRCPSPLEKERADTGLPVSSQGGDSRGLVRVLAVVILGMLFHLRRSFLASVRERWQVEDVVGVVALAILALIDLLVCRDLANKTTADQFIYRLGSP